MPSTTVAGFSRRALDRAVGAAFDKLASDERARRTFTDLLGSVRRSSSRVFDAPLRDHEHPGVDALMNLARFEDAWRRPAAAWPGSDGSWPVVVHALASHLVAEYPVPRFLASAWFANGAFGEDQRRWFIEHAAGAPFRALSLPVPLTRRMEHHFLHSPDHLSIGQALHRAELIAIGAHDALIAEVLATTASGDLEHGDFWREIWRFLVTNRRDLSAGDAYGMVDFIHTIRHESTRVETGTGPVDQPPPLPDFSVKGRTVESLRRLMDAWSNRRPLGDVRARWTPSPQRALTLEIHRTDRESPTIWQIVELTDSRQLEDEGVELRHCVGGYTRFCWSGWSRIWSLRRRRTGDWRSIATIEVDPPTRTIVQVKGFRNRQPPRGVMRIVRSWAKCQGLRVNL